MPDARLPSGRPLRTFPGACQLYHVALAQEVDLVVEAANHVEEKGFRFTEADGDSVELGSGDRPRPDGTATVRDLLHLPAVRAELPGEDLGLLLLEPP